MDSDVIRIKTKKLPCARLAIFLISGGVLGPGPAEAYSLTTGGIIEIAVDQVKDSHARICSTSCTSHVPFCRLQSACREPSSPHPPLSSSLQDS